MKISKAKLAEIRKRIQAKKQDQAQKALDPNEITILSNVQSLLNELLQGSQPAAAVEVSKEELPTTDDMKDKIDKGLESTASDSATASDDAETRIDETQTETTEDSVNEVAKALVEALKNVRKDKGIKKVNPIVEAIQGLVQVQKSTQSQIDDLAEGFANVLEGMGLVEQMKVTKSAQNNEVKKGITTGDTQALANLFAQMLNNSKVQKSEEDNKTLSNSQIIRKNLADKNVLKSLIANKM